MRCLSDKNGQFLLVNKTAFVNIYLYLFIQGEQHNSEATNQESSILHLCHCNTNFFIANNKISLSEKMNLY